MKNVLIEIFPLLSETPRYKTSSPVFLEVCVQEKGTLEDLVNQLIASYQAFRQALFDPERQQIRDNINVVHRDRLFHLTGGLDTVLEDGDRVVFLALPAGG